MAGTDGILYRCEECLQSLPRESFRWWGKENRRSSICRACMKAGTWEHRAKTRQLEDFRRHLERARRLRSPIPVWVLGELSGRTPRHASDLARSWGFGDVLDYADETALFNRSNAPGGDPTFIPSWRWR